MFEYVVPTETKNLRESSRGRKDEKPVLQPVEPPTKDVTDSKKVDKKLNKNKKDNLRLRGVSKKTTKSLTKRRKTIPVRQRRKLNRTTVRTKRPTATRKHWQQSQQESKQLRAKLLSHRHHFRPKKRWKTRPTKIRRPLFARKRAAENKAKLPSHPRSSKNKWSYQRFRKSLNPSVKQNLNPIQKRNLNPIRNRNPIWNPNRNPSLSRSKQTTNLHPSL